MNQSEIDMAGLNLYDEEAVGVIPDEPAKPPAAIEKLIEEAKTALTAQEQGDKRSLSLVVIGKSTGLAYLGRRTDSTPRRPCRCGQVDLDGPAVVRARACG